MKRFNLTSIGRLASDFRWCCCLVVVLIFGGNLFAESKLKVAKIEIIGNDAFSTGELKSILKSAEKKTFNARYLRLDRILLTNYYTLRGFLNVFVSRDFRKEGDKIFIKYSITEGRRYYFKAINFAGQILFSAEALRRHFPIQTGEPFQRRVIESGLNHIENLYANHGKPYVTFSVTKETSDDTLIDVNIAIDEGVSVTITDIRYEGLKLVKSFLIRRELVINKKELFSREKIQASQRNIYSTGLFQFVNYRVEPISDDATKAVLVWRIVEKKPIWLGFRFGVGHKSGDVSGNITTFDFTAEAGHRNIAGTARSVSMKVVPSLLYGRETKDSPRRWLNPRNEYTVTYIEPWVLSTRTPGIFRLSWIQESEPVAVVPYTSLESAFNLSHKFANSFWSYTTGISFQRVKLRQNNTVVNDSSQTNVNQAIQLISGGKDLIYAFTFIPLKDKRDNVLVPQRGSLTEFFNKFAYTRSRPIIANQLQDTLVTNIFYKFNAQWNRYQGFALNKKWVLATRLRGAGIIEFGKPKPIEFFPATERFYLGGSNTIRGYAEQRIGRITQFTDNSGDTLEIPVGGKYVVLGNIELRIPLFWLFQTEVFVDAGNLFEEKEDFKHFSLKVGSGVGLAVITPFGPIRFDYGIKLFKNQNESRGNFHIGISFAF